MENSFITTWSKNVKAKNFGAIKEQFAPDSRLISPVAFKPYEGRDLIVGTLQAVISTIPDIKYTKTETFERGAIMIFEGTIARTNLRIEGIDIFSFDANGRIDELKVMMRPLKAAMEFARVMQSVLEKP